MTYRILDVDGYKAEVISDKYNPLIGRRELVLRVDHPLKPTPTRLQLRFSIAKAFKTEVEKVYVRSVKTEYGMGVSRVEAHIYDSVERAQAFEPKYVVERNGGVRPQQ